ncbi:MAG TPA: PEP-CTERM sorting domain-containing protein, partial [Pirellulales bacterium]
VYGPGGGVDLTSPAFASQFVNGFATISLMQVETKGDVRISVDFPSGQYLSFGQATYALPGVGVLNFASPSLVGANFVRVPEPSSCVLAALGLCGMLIAHRRRARRRTTDVSQV